MREPGCSDCKEASSGQCLRHTYVAAAAPFAQTTWDMPASRVPFCCPVCHGAGTVSKPPTVAGDQLTWSEASSALWPCHACQGTGIVWSQEK